MPGPTLGGASLVQRHNHLPCPAGHFLFDASQDTLGFLGCKSTLLAHVKLLINQHYKVLLLEAALNPITSNHFLFII